MKSTTSKSFLRGLARVFNLYGMNNLGKMTNFINCIIAKANLSDLFFKEGETCTTY